MEGKEYIRQTVERDFDSMRRHFMGIAIHYGLQDEDAEDIVSETFKNILGAKTFKGQLTGSYKKNNNLRAWASTIARNNVRERYRRLGKNPVKRTISFHDEDEDELKELHPASNALSPLEKMEIDEEKKLIERGLRLINKNKRRILKMYLNGVNYKDIARIQNIDPRVAMMRVFRGKKDLIKIVHKMCA